MVVVSTDGRALQVNRAFREMLGYAEGELLAMSFESVTHPDDLEATVDNIARLFAGELRVFEMEKRYVHKHGHVVWGILNVSLARHPQGDPAYLIAHVRDVTARKQAEDTLKGSEARYRSIVNTTATFIARADAEGRFTFINEAYRRMLGKPLEELIGQSYLDVVHEDDRAKIPAVSQQMLGSPVERTRFDCRILTPGGSAWVTWDADAIQDEHGVITELQAVGRDVTIHKAAENALKASEARYRGLVESPAAFIVRIDPEGRFTFVNNTYCRKLGKYLDELIGRPCITVVHEDDVAETLAALEQTLEAPSYRGRVDCRVRTPSGWSWIAWEGCAIRDAPSACVEIQAVGVDVTERKEVEQELRKSQERYRGLVESQQDLVARFDRRGRSVFVNAAYCRKFGKSLEELLGTSFMPLVHEDDRPARTAAMRGLDNPPYRARVDARSPTPEGWRWISWEVCAIKDERSATLEWQVVGRDVTERRATDEALRASLDELRRSEEKLRLLAQRQVQIREDERKRLSFDLHDDVCQELVGIAIIVESLRRRLQPLPPAATADLERVVRYLNEVVEHLRLLARDLRPMLLHDLGLDGSLRALAEGMSSDTTRVVARFETAIPRLSEESELAVYRIAQEALANAARHAAAGSIVLALGVTDAMLRLEVRDDGRGFVLQDRERSAALGLVSMEERALALGGHLEVWSEPGKGTAVRLECPLTSHAPATAA